MLRNQSKTPDDSGGQERSKSAKNKGVTAGKGGGGSTSNKPSKVPVADNTNTASVTNSDKQNNKLSNKPIVDSDLALVVEAWPELPEAIRSAIVAIVRASNKQ